MKDELVTFFIFINYTSTSFTYLCSSSADSFIAGSVSAQKYWYCERKDKPAASPRKRRKSSLRRVYRLWTQTELLYRVCFYRIYLLQISHALTSFRQKSICGGDGWGKIAFVDFASKRLYCQPLKNLLKARFCLFILTTIFAQSTLTNAMNLIYFNAVRDFAHISPFRVVRKRNKNTVAGDITQWKGDQFLIVRFHDMNVCWVIIVTLKF